MIVVARVPVSSVATRFIGRAATSPHWDVLSSYADMRDTIPAKARTGQRPVPCLALVRCCVTVTPDSPFFCVRYVTETVSALARTWAKYELTMAMRISLAVALQSFVLDASFDL